MVVYILTFALSIALLLAAWRALGSEASPGDDAESFVAHVCVWLDADARLLAPMGDLRAGDALPEGAVATARTVRKKLNGYQQQLSRLPAGEALPEERALRQELTSIMESLTWVCRMVEAGTEEAGVAICAAIQALYGDAAERARPLASQAAAVSSLSRPDEKTPPSR